MRQKVTFAAATAVLLCFAGIASAQFDKGSSEAGFVVGGAIPTTKSDLTDLVGKNQTAVKTGITAGGRYLYHTSPEWAFGGEASYAAFGDKKHDIGIAEITESAAALDVQGIAKYTFAADKKSRPYLIGGVGYGSMKQKNTTKPINGNSWIDTGTTESRTNYDETIGALAVSLGAGFEHFFNDTTILTIEGRWKHLGTDKNITDDTLGVTWDINSTNAVLITAGLSWKFGK